jgi:hypothetical protein
VLVVALVVLVVGGLAAAGWFLRGKLGAGGGFDGPIQLGAPTSAPVAEDAPAEPEPPTAAPSATAAPAPPPTAPAGGRRPAAAEDIYDSPPARPRPGGGAKPPPTSKYDPSGI